MGGRSDRRRGAVSRTEWRRRGVSISGLADPMVIAAQGVGEPLGHGGVLTLLPERDHDQLARPLGTADVDDIATLQVADEDRSAGPGLDPAGGVGAGDAGGDLGLLVERSADPLAEAFGGVVGDGDEHLGADDDRRLVGSNLKPGSPGILFGFVGGDNARSYNGISASDRQAAMINQYTSWLGSRAASPVAYFDTNWSDEIWTRGCPVGIPSLGMLLAYGPQIRQPVGRIHWAGTETSTYWNGYMDGAVRSGERAAAEALSAL